MGFLRYPNAGDAISHNAAQEGDSGVGPTPKPDPGQADGATSSGQEAGGAGSGGEKALGEISRIQQLLSGTGSLAPILAAGVVVLLAFNYTQVKLPPILWLVLMLFVTILFYLVRLIIAKPKGGVPSILKVGHLERAALSIFIVIVACGIILIIVVVSSVITGFPLEMRHYLNSAIIKREPIEGKKIDLAVLEGGTLFKRQQPLAPRDGRNLDEEKRRLVWEEWMYNGATSGDMPPTVKVYRSRQFNDYHHQHSGRIIFEGIDKEAILADCIGFIVNTDKLTNAESLRMMDITGFRNNMDSKDDARRANRVENLILNNGDSIVIIAQFAQLATDSKHTARIDLD